MGEPITYIAYADNVALTASTPAGLQASMDALVTKAGQVGLEVGHNQTNASLANYDGKQIPLGPSSCFNTELAMLVSISMTFFAGYAQIQVCKFLQQSFGSGILVYIKSYTNTDWSLNLLYECSVIGYGLL